MQAWRQPSEMGVESGHPGSATQRGSLWLSHSTYQSRQKEPSGRWQSEAALNEADCKKSWVTTTAGTNATATPAVHPSTRRRVTRHPEIAGDLGRGPAEDHSWGSFPIEVQGTGSPPCGRRMPGVMGAPQMW